MERSQELSAQRVVGIGGVFLRAREPETLRAWYADHLGIELEDYGGSIFRDSGVTVWAVFPRDSDYFGRQEQQAMVNYRVADLDAILAQLRRAGVSVDEHIEEGQYGRFAWAADPEGNRFELWEPPS